MNGLTRELMAIRAAQELQDGMFVNLGIGLPSLVSDFIPADRQVILQSENGVLGVGKIAEEQPDTDLVNASGNPVSVIPGASFFDSGLSFAMIRGGHIDVCILGAFQVSEQGDLANWLTAEQKAGGVGGAMDLAVGAKRVIVLMEHARNDGTPRIVKKCSLPLTGERIVKTIITNLAVIEIEKGRLWLKELAPGITVDEVQEATEPKLVISKDLKDMEL